MRVARLLLFLAIAAFAVTSTVQADIITGVDRSGGTSGDRGHIGVFDGDTDPSTAQPDPLPDSMSLQDGHYVFSDRTYPWANTPAELVGAEYIQTFNTDKGGGGATVNYAVTIGEPAIVAITVDDRWLTEHSVPLQIKADEIVAAFAAPGTFSDTDLDLFVREREDGTRDRAMSVFAAPLPPGTYDFGPLGSNLNFYTIGAVPIPEPSTLAMLVSITLLGLTIWRHRR